MYRISPQNLLWALESLVRGDIVNPIRVPETTKQWARVALDRMLQVHELQGTARGRGGTHGV
jgi:quinolinate synthase